LLPAWYDVDDAATLERLRIELGEASAGYDAKHTRAYLESLQAPHRIDSVTTSRAC
jgi:hypothetical protein